MINGLDLHVVDEGHGRPPLLLVHGFTGSDLDWVDVQPALAEQRRVVSYTHRGHAGSAQAAPYTLDALVGDLGAAIDHLDLPPLHLLGHSMGGIIAMRYALANPDRLVSLVLMDTFAASPADSPIAGMIDAIADTARRDGMGAVVNVMRPFLAGMPPKIAERVEYKMSHMDPNAFVSLGRELTTLPSVVGRLGELARMPVTVLVGADDAALVEPAHVMHDAIPGSDLEVIAGAGHSPQEDRPDEWLRVIEKHLAR